MKCLYGRLIILIIILFGLVKIINLLNKDNKFIKYDGIKFEEPIQNNNFIGGKVWKVIYS